MGYRNEITDRQLLQYRDIRGYTIIIIKLN